MACQQVTANFLIPWCTYMLHAHTCCKPVSIYTYPLVQVHTLTASHPVVSRELERIFGAVPAFPRKLELTLFNATLGTHGHAGSVGQVGLAKGKGSQASALAQLRPSGEGAQAGLKWVSSPGGSNQGFFWVGDSWHFFPLPSFPSPK